MGQVTWNGQPFIIPEVGESQWGVEVTNLLTSFANNALSKSGGSFVVTADVNFGNNFGALLKYLKSVSPNIAQTGFVRLANDEGFAWRDAANGADLVFKVNSSNRLQFNSVNVPTISSTDTFTNKTVVVANNTITTASSGNLAATELNAALAELQADIDTRVVASGLTESVQDIVGALVQDSASIDATYDDAGAIESLAVLPAGVDKNSLGGSALSIANGGTGQASQTEAFDALSPTTTKGDLIVFNGTDNVRFPAGANGTVLSYDSAEASGLKAIAPLTNPMTTAGDLIYGGASGVATRLPGAAGVLHGAAGSAPSYSTIVDADVSASAAIAGSKLQAAASGNAGAVSTSNQVFGGRKNGSNSKVRARLSGNQSIPASTDTRINFTTEDFDTNGEYASSTFTPTRSGYYLVNGSVRINSLASGKTFMLWIYKNGATIVARQRFTAPSAGDYSLRVSDIVSMNGSSDFLQLMVRQEDTTSRDVESTGADSFFSVTELF